MLRAVDFAWWIGACLLWGFFCGITGFPPPFSVWIGLLIGGGVVLWRMKKRFDEV